MSKIEKLVAKLLANPLPVSFTYQELVRLMAFFGHEVKAKASGSRVRFTHPETKSVCAMHRPHPGNELKKYQILQVIEFLKEQGDLDVSTKT